MREKWGKIGNWEIYFLQSQIPNRSKIIMKIPKLIINFISSFNIIRVLTFVAYKIPFPGPGARPAPPLENNNDLAYLHQSLRSQGNYWLNGSIT